MKKKTAIVALLSVFAASSAGAVLASGCNNPVGYIDAPTNLEEDLGTYVVPDYDVVNKNGMILAGYNVYLKSATDADGNRLQASHGTVTIDTAGVYKFVYSAGNRRIKDVTVSIDFADRTAPTINYDDRNLPEFFISGNEYRVPQYTLSGDFVREKCWAKVFYVDENNNESEVQIESGRFLVDKAKGSYAIRIHVEDAVGNANDYEYVRKVDGPEKHVENRVLYFNEAFGARQVSCNDNAYKGEYVTKDTEGAQVYKSEDGTYEEEGSYKVTFDGVTETQYNEGLINMNVPALINLYEYERLEMWVYNDSDRDIIMGSWWWNDTKIEKGKWNKITWSTREWGGVNGNKDSTNTKFVGVTDISNMTIRFVFDYGQKVIPNGTFYLSSMNAVPKIPSAVTEKACATEGGGVQFDQSKYFYSDTVKLSAKEVSGKVLDCFKVDGKVIPGNTFTVTGDSHEVEAVYVDAPLTVDGMTWATVDTVTPAGDDAQVHKLGEGKNWVLKYDVYDIGAEGWDYFAAYVGGADQLLGFELSNNTGKFCGYGGSWKWGDGVALSSDMVALLRGATEQKPATIVYIRDGSTVKTFVEYDGVSHFIATVDLSKTLECSGDSFGIGARKRSDKVQINNVTPHNIRVVATKDKTELVHETYAATVTKGDSVVDFVNKNYRIGDTVTLSAPKENEGKLFLCFKVGEINLTGNSFVITEKNVTVSAVYTDACTITLDDGLTIDGKGGTVTLPAGVTVEVAYSGVSPDGQYYAGILVDGEEAGYTFTVEKSVAVTVRYKDRVANDNEKLNDISKAGEEDALVYHPSQNGWKPTSVEYVTDFGYDGENGTVDAKNTLKVTLSGDEQAFGLANGSESLDKYSEIYFYVYSDKSGIAVGGWWCRDAVTVAGKWVKVSLGRDKEPQNVNEKSVWKEGLNGFIYSFNGSQSGDVVYVTAVYGVPYADVTVTKDTDSEEYLGLSSPKYGTKYKVNETVTLTCSGAPSGKAFASFTVNGEDIEGNTYKLTAEGAEFGVRFAEISAITVENGASVADITANQDGKYIIGRGAKITLSHENKTGKIFDYYLVDNTLKVHTDTFVTSTAAHTVKAVYADSKAQITWAENDTDRYTKEKVMGNTETSEWFNTKFNGQIFGSADNWAIKATVKTADTGKWHSVTFVTGSKQALLMRWNGTDKWFSFCFIDEKGNENAPAGSGLDYAYVNNIDSSRTPEQIALRQTMTGKLKAGTEITVIRSGNEIKVFADNQQVLSVTDVIDCTGNWFGVGTGFDPDAPQVSNIEFITGEQKIQALMETAGVIDTGSLNGSIVRHADGTYTVPTFTAKNLLGVQSDAQVTAVVKDARGNVLAQTAGKVTLPEYEGAQHVTITYSAQGCADATVTVNLQKADSKVLMQASELGAALINANGNTVAYSTEQKHGDDEGSIKVSNIVSNETGIFLHKSEYSRYVEFYAYTADSGVKMGGWWCCDTAIAQNCWTKVIIDTQTKGYDVHGGEIVLRLMGESQGKTVYISSVRTYDAPEQKSETQLNSIETAVVYDGSAELSMADLPATLDDENVKETSVLKVDAKGGELALRVWGTYAATLDEYEEVYFWVYVTYEGLQAGTHWCGNTDLVANQWTKVTITRDTNWAWDGGVVHNGVPTGVSGNPYEKGTDNFVYRLMNGENKTFYVTSLYGVPKA